MTIASVNFNLVPTDNSHHPFIVAIDGSAHFSRRPTGIGVRISQPDQRLFKEISRFIIGIKTNNQAEPEALLVGLQELHSVCPNHPVVIKTDSELVYRQLLTNWQKPHHKEVVKGE